MKINTNTPRFTKGKMVTVTNSNIDLQCFTFHEMNYIKSLTKGDTFLLIENPLVINSKQGYDLSKMNKTWIGEHGLKHASKIKFISQFHKKWALKYIFDGKVCYSSVSKKDYNHYLAVFREKYFKD